MSLHVYIAAPWELQADAQHLRQVDHVAIDCDMLTHILTIAAKRGFGVGR
jgi:hypothetical protein